MGVDTINLNKEWQKWRTLVNTALTRSGRIKCGEFFSDWLLKEDCSMEIR
jgi:hypothetical protein